MGCGSSRVFVVDETIPGQNSEAVRAFRILELSDDDIEKLYVAFKKFDIINNEMVEIGEFLPRLGLEKNRLTKEVFANIDHNDDGRINFREFVLSVWKYVVLGKHDIAGFAFDMYDTDNSGFLSEDEVINLVAELYGTKHLEDSVNKILHPAFDIQSKMRTKVVGESFWKQKELVAARILQNPDVKRLLQNRTKQQDSAVAAMHLPQHEHDPNAVHHDKGSKKTAHNHKN